MLIKNAELDGTLVDVRVTTEVVEIGQALHRQTSQQMNSQDCIDAQGGALLPGLHDHHVHLYASAAAQSSVDCAQLGPDQGEQLAALLTAAPGQQWLRVVGYHESMAGDLDRFSLDALCSQRPVRVQHSSGKCWIINTEGLDALALQPQERPSGLELDATGTPTGRLWRMDDWLRMRLGDSAVPSLFELSERLARFGITGVTDISFTNDLIQQERLLAARECGELLQKLCLFGDDTLTDVPLKIMLDEDDLPPLDDLVERIQTAAQNNRGIALHCVSHVELMVALAGLEGTGRPPTVRIEHGGVIHAELYPRLRACGVTVVTQPGFIAQRGERFRRQADARDLPHLYPYASLLNAGIPVAASSDAPYGPLNPWEIMASAVQRKTESGQVLGAGERVTAAEALRGYLAAPEAPGGPARVVVEGAAADLCILDRPLAHAMADPGAVNVAFTLIDGRLVWRSAQ